MLTPDFLWECADEVERIANIISMEVSRAIADRIIARLTTEAPWLITSADVWQMQSIQEAGLVVDDIQMIIAKNTGVMKEAIQKAFIDAGLQSFKYDNEVYRAAGIDAKDLQQSPYYVRLLERAYNSTEQTWRNLTRTMPSAGHNAYIRECDTAYWKVTGGNFSRAAAVEQAVMNVAKSGNYVTYDSGHRDTIEVATARAVRTGIHQATAEITNKRMEEFKWDIVLVSSHLGARVTDAEDYTNHAWWQGQFYSLSGKDTRFKPFSVCGYGDVQGIHGANCRHSHGPGDGVFNPFDQYDSEENKKVYEATQQQRKMERSIRKIKKVLQTVGHAAGGAKDDEVKKKMETQYQKYSKALVNAYNTYNEFCSKNDLRPEEERVRVAGWTYRDEREAVRTAMEANNG